MTEHPSEFIPGEQPEHLPPDYSEIDPRTLTGEHIGQVFAFGILNGAGMLGRITECTLAGLGRAADGEITMLWLSDTQGMEISRCQVWHYQPGLALHRHQLEADLAGLQPSAADDA